MVYITRKENFCAAHKLHRKEWSQEKNLEVFGKCANPNWHGHNYSLFVTVKGEVNPQTGFVMNISELSEIVQKFVIEKLDHKNINMDVDFMQNKMASTENLIIGIWEQLEKPITEKNCKLHYIKLQETEKNFVEYYGNVEL